MTPIADSDGTALAIGDTVRLTLTGRICDISLPQLGIDIQTDFGTLQAMPPRTVTRLPADGTA